ncbi:sugar phosphate isomerase/epimerase [Rubellicoccus peritrichatus]|uniref:Sugar phosphate isomerase/epimerase n=1 Tax=Rubellicoccus peritrichatus TaxID=3080537 RepID=A0AAQ3LCD9_9BACT|nr:sugar phosphate isomerase/epimerase [Puniceicoccus sp. CR14]WOO41904.1 sugar phosphate isomerase/epimerase [Puniceicoccus sp. CR14]
MKDTISIGTLAGQGPRTADYIKEILPHGFESFQINFWMNLGGTDLKKLSGEVKEVIADKAVVSSLGIFGNPLADSKEGQDARDGWVACIDHAADFGTDLVCGFAGRVIDKPVPESMERYKEVFGDLAKRAADKGIRLAFENCPMGGDWNRGDWNIAFNPAAWDLMFDALPNDNIGLEWEPCHQMCQLIDPMPQLRKYAEKIFHIHGKDATVRNHLVSEKGIYSPDHFAFHRHPGFGDSNWTDIISELRAIGFKGAIDIEGWHDPVYKDELEMTGQVHALRYLKQCRTELIPGPKGF